MSDENRHAHSAEAELEQLRQSAWSVFGLQIDPIVQSGSAANLVGLRSEYLLFSRRLDSRTYFVQDSRYGIDREAGVFQGSDREYTRASRGILRRLRIPASEIANEAVFKEQTQVARVDHETREIYKEEVQEGKQFARLSRVVEKLPVWSSSLVLGLTRDRSIGYLQLHWPELPGHVAQEAHHLAYQVSQGWRPPEQPDADVEAVEAGVIHSPAIALLMDIYPVIRVVYRPTDSRLGKKPVWYYDRHGSPCPLPRQADMPLEAPLQRPPARVS